MSKIVVFNDILRYDLFLARYLEGDEDMTHVTVCKNLPEAKIKLKEKLENLIKEIDKLKLKDI